MWLEKAAAPATHSRLSCSAKGSSLTHNKSKEQNLGRNHAIIHPKMHLCQKYKPPAPVGRSMHSLTCINIPRNWLGQTPTYCTCSATHRLTDSSFNFKYRWSPGGRVEVIACVAYFCIFTYIYSTCSRKLFFKFQFNTKIRIFQEFSTISHQISSFLNKSSFVSTACSLDTEQHLLAKSHNFLNKHVFCGS